MTARPLAALVLLAATLALPAAARAALPETLLLDVHDPTPRAQPTAVGTNALEAGRAYVVTVEGTYSIVPAGRWSHPAVCGTPLVAPLFPSPGVENGPVGLDAELQFARTADRGCSGDYPRRHNRFQIDVGTGFRHVPAEGEPFAVPAGSYRYDVVGTGELPRFRVWDDPAADNYGQLRVTVAAAAPDAPLSPPPGRTAHVLGRCLARRVLRLQIGDGAVVQRARVFVDGHRWGHVRYGRRVIARVDLRNVTRSHVRVRVRVLTRDGRSFARARTYGTCARRARSEI